MLKYFYQALRLVEVKRVVRTKLKGTKRAPSPFSLTVKKMVTGTFGYRDYSSPSAAKGPIVSTASGRRQEEKW